MKEILTESWHLQYSRGMSCKLDKGHYCQSTETKIGVYRTRHWHECHYVYLKFNHISKILVFLKWNRIRETTTIQALRTGNNSSNVSHLSDGNMHLIRRVFPVLFSTCVNQIIHLVHPWVSHLSSIWLKPVTPWISLLHQYMFWLDEWYERARTCYSFRV